MKSGKWSLDSLVLIFSIIVFAQLLTYVVPQGSFDRQAYPDNPSREMVVAGSYESAADEERVLLDPWYFLQAIPTGFAEAEGIIFLIFVAGGVIKVLRRTGAIDAFLHKSVERLGASPWILIGGCLLLFSVGAYFIGMGEEYVPLVPIIVTMSLAMRMDAIVAMGMVWIPYGIGWACAGTNPFGVLIAQSIAGVPLSSGAGLRFIMMLCFLAVAFHHLYRYALMVQRDPSKSLVADIDYSEGFEAPDDIDINGQRIAILAVFVAGIIFFVWGAKAYGWYVPELMAVFMGIGIIAAAIARLSAGSTEQGVHRRCSGNDRRCADCRLCTLDRGRSDGRPDHRHGY